MARSCRKEYFRQYHQRNKVRRNQAFRRYYIKRKYGLTLQEFEAMLRSQNRKCLICETKHKKGKPLAVDHNHTTGKIRGLICMQCNSGIGLLKDSPDLLRKALRYLRERS